MLDLAQLRDRQNTYLTGHYVALHTMIVSLALGAGAVAAGTIISMRFTGPSSLSPYLPVLAMLLGANFVGVVVVYGGPLHGVIFLPGGIPGVLDLILPLLLGFAEFAIFGVLATSATSWATPSLVIGAWWVTMAAFGLCGVAQIARVFYLMKTGIYSADAEPLASTYVGRLKVQLYGASATTVLSAGWAVLILTRFDEFTRLAHILSASVILIVLGIALWSHGVTGRLIKRGLR